MLDSLACGLVKLLGAALTRLSPEAAVGFGIRLGRCLVPLQAKRARIGELNLKAAYGERLSPAQRRRIIRDLYGNLGAGLVEMLRLPAMDQAYIDRYVEFQGAEHVYRAREAGRPVVFLTGHFGNWEMCSIAGALKGYPLVALARAQDRLPKLYQLLVSYRESKGCRIVHKGGAMRALLRTLQQGGLVGIVGDQASRQGIFVEFFGRPALFATGPFELAHASGAVIIPSFMHRVRGPRMRLVFEPPIELAREREPEAAVREGIERFAAILRRHIEQDPDQWLWAHKRWKHTPACRVLILSDGKLGHVKQSRAVAQAIRAHQPSASEQVIEVRYRSRFARVIALLWAWLMPGAAFARRCLAMTLTPDCFRELAGAYADVVVSCGSSSAPVTVLAAAENQAKSVIIMNPAPIPLGRFSLAFVPAHDRVSPAKHVVRTVGGLNAIGPAELEAARSRLLAHPRFRATPAAETAGPLVSVLLGGDTPDYQITPEFAQALVAQVLLACERLGGSCLVTTSRRTSPEAERALAEQTAGAARCRMLLLAGRDQLNGTLEGMLGLAQVIVVTAESVSMVTEACASGRPVIVVEPPARGASSHPTKPRRLLERLLADGYARTCAVSELGAAIETAAASPTPAKRLDTYQLVRDAVGSILR